MRIELGSNQESLKRPSWTSKDLHAYRHKHTTVHGRFVILKDYYVKSKGLMA